MKARWILAALGVFMALAALWYASSEPLREPRAGRSSGTDLPQFRSESSSTELGAAIVEAPARVAEPHTATTPSPFDPADDHDHTTIEDLTGDLRFYEANPMSRIPHHVARGWGARGAGEVSGVVGAYVIVSPGISDEDLTELARDIRRFHDDAIALSVRILDLEVAATYDRHTDAGVMAAAHLVGLVNVNTRLGMDRIMIRGRLIESASPDSS